jgi:hypothetical protein
LKPAIAKGDKVTLVWDVAGTNDTEIVLEGIGTVTGKTSIDVELVLLQ